MDADDLSRVTALVAAQLADHAAEQRAERDRLYSMVSGLATSSTQLAKNVNAIAADAEARTGELIKAFAEGFTERIMPLLIARADGATSAKASPGMTEAVSTAIVEGTKDLLRRTVEPLIARIESLENRTPRDR